MKSNVTGQEKDGNMRPPTRCKERKRITGWLAGHKTHFEIEDVLDK